MEILTGDILVVMEGKWSLARAIRKVTSSRAHHTALMVWVGDALMVSEMEARGHLLTPWGGAKYDGGRPEDRTLVIMRLKTGFPDPAGLQEFAIRDQTQYDFLALLQHVIMRFTGLWIGRKGATAANRLTCSERVGFVYNRFTGLYVKWWKCSPRDIVDNHVELFEFFAVK